MNHKPATYTTHFLGSIRSYRSVKYVTLLHIIVTYIKENIIAKLQKLYSPPRKLKVGNKYPALFLKKPHCTGDLSPVCKIFIEKPKLNIGKDWFRIKNQ